MGGGVFVGALVVVLGLVALSALGGDDDEGRPAGSQLRSQATAEATEEGKTPTPSPTPTVRPTATATPSETPTATPTEAEATETPIPSAPYASAQFLVPFTLDLPQGWIVNLDTQKIVEFLFGQPLAALDLINYVGAPGLVELPPEEILQKVLTHGGELFEVQEDIATGGTVDGWPAASLIVSVTQGVRFTEGVLKDQQFRAGDLVLFVAVSVDGKAVLAYAQALQEDWEQYGPFFESIWGSLDFS